MNDMSIALGITLLGMGLVFGAIILLWVMMILLTSFTPEKEDEPESNTEKNAAPQVNSDLSQVAALAVAVALAEQSLSSARPLKTPETTIVSAWQLGMRMRHSSERRNRKR